jgi:hypothetical protein
MKLVISDSQELAVLLRSLNKSIYLINYGIIYEVLYVRQPQPVENIEGLQPALLQLYSIHMQFLARLTQAMKSSASSRTFSLILSSEAVANFEKESEKSEQKVESRAKDLEQFYDHNTETESAQRAERLKALLQEMRLQDIIGNEKVTEPDNHPLPEDEHLNMLKWVSNISYWNQHKKARKRRGDQSNEWIFNQPQYKKWRSADESMILWLHGPRKSSTSLDPPDIKF